MTQPTPPVPSSPQLQPLVAPAPLQPEATTTLANGRPPPLLDHALAPPPRTWWSELLGTPGLANDDDGGTPIDDGSPHALAWIGFFAVYGFAGGTAFALTLLLRAVCHPWRRLWSARYDRVHQTIDDPKEGEEDHVPNGSGACDEVEEDEFDLDRNLLLLRTTNGNAAAKLDESEPLASPRLADDTLGSPRLADSPPRDLLGAGAARHDCGVNEECSEKVAAQPPGSSQNGGGADCDME